MGEVHSVTASEVQQQPFQGLHCVEGNLKSSALRMCLFGTGTGRMLATVQISFPMAYIEGVGLALYRKRKQKAYR